VTLESMFYLTQSIAAVAIVGSLLFVALEVRSSNQVNRHRAIEELLEDYTRTRMSIAGSPEVARAWLSGLHDYEALDSLDKARFSLTADVFFHTHESIYLHHRGGRMNRGMYEPQWLNLIDMLRYPGLQSVWAFRKRYFHVAYQSHLDETIAKARTLGSTPGLYGENPRQTAGQ